MTTSRAPDRSSSEPDRRRLLDELPEVFLAPDALTGLGRQRGLLLGDKRHRQVDVFGIARGAGVASDAVGLIRGRLDRSSIEGWRIVGVALGADDLEPLVERVLDGLVPGDLVVAGSDPVRILIHRGDRLVPIRTLRGAA